MLLMIDNYDSFTYNLVQYFMELGQTVEVLVEGGSTPPSFLQSLEDRTDVVGAAVSIDAGAADPDSSTLAYAASGLPPGISVDPSTGLAHGIKRLTYDWE